ncbi:MULTISPECIES: serine hydrolase [unclassified Dietzia]|uniref:serine hydrolase n=1 Tax=unclassified Dietzia TaxID=2617939 RepID=UPI000D200C06|nr:MULTISPECIES: serine hydrolase [unclassified Dietzia]AVZ38431.1 serine hydrolase [Dietzia sp. JS16-p6b]
MARYRSDTPAARLRDAPVRARRRSRRLLRLAAGGYGALCLAAVLGVAVTAPGADLANPDTASASTRPASAQPSASVPDGRVEDPAHRVRPLPSGWREVGPLLSGAVAEAEQAGHELAACVLAIDAPDERVVCSGEDDPRYAASVMKVAFAVAALEAWDADPTAQTPYGTLGDLLEAAIPVSDNDAANLLYDLSVDGPSAPDTDDPNEAINEVADRVGLADEFHTGGAFRGEWTGDWSRVSARGSVGYLTELVRAADGRASAGEALTSPAVARTVLGLLSDQERLWKLPAHLPEGSTANKTGETDTESHDIAVVNTTSGRYAIAVIATATGPDDTPDEVIADLGRDVARALGGAVRF